VTRHRALLALARLPGRRAGVRRGMSIWAKKKPACRFRAGGRGLLQASYMQAS